MSETPLADSIRKLRSEGLNATAASQVAEIALDYLKASLPQYFDNNGEPWPRDPITTATAFEEPYFKTPKSE